MLNSTYARLAAIASAVLGCGAIWRAGLAVWHYRASLKIIDDPSVRELEQVSALFELGLAIVFLAHAVAAAYLIRRPLQTEGFVVGAVAALTGAGVAGSLLQIPVLGAPGFLPASVVFGCAGAGLFTRTPWVSSYLGALVGSSLGFFFATPTIDPLVYLAVIVPPAVLAILGVALGRLIRRLGLFQGAA